MKFTRKHLLLSAVLAAGIGLAPLAYGAASTVFNLLTSLTGNEIIVNTASNIGNAFKTSVLKSYITGFTNHAVVVGQGSNTTAVGVGPGATGSLLQGAGASADPAFATTLTGSYTLSGTNTLSGANTFTGALNQLGSASGVPSHLSTAQTTAPALTSCGTGSPAITGTDTAGIVTMGTSATGCVITFNVAYTGTPYCVVSWIATPLASQSYVTANTAITTTQTSTSGNKLQYVCVGTAGG